MTNNNKDIQERMAWTISFIRDELFYVEDATKRGNKEFALKKKRHAEELLEILRKDLYKLD